MPSRGADGPLPTEGNRVVPHTEHLIVETASSSESLGGRRAKRIVNSSSWRSGGVEVTERKRRVGGSKAIHHVLQADAVGGAASTGCLPAAPHPQSSECAAPAAEVEVTSASMPGCGEAGARGAAPGLWTVNEVDVMVDRHRYAKFIVSQLRATSGFCSPLVLVQKMLRELRSSDVHGPSHRVSGAMWALAILASTPGYEVIGDVRETLLPYVFDQYDQTLLDDVSPSLTVMLQDRRLLHHNPYFSHRTVPQMYALRAQEAESKTAALARAVMDNVSRRRGVERMVLGRLRRQQLQAAFRLWRSHARNGIVEGMGRRARERRERIRADEEKRRSTWAAWRLVVEQARIQFLYAKLEQSSQQIESARYQYQLQCMRADDLEAKLNESRKEVQRLQAEVEDLKSPSSLFWKKFGRQCGECAASKALGEVALRDVRRVMQVGMRWKEFATQCVTSSHSVSVDIDANVLRRIRAYCTKLREMKAASDDADLRATSSRPQRLLAAPEMEICRLLLKWCSSIMRAGSASQAKPLTNFSDDFASGIVLLAVLHRVLGSRAEAAAVSRTAHIPEERRFALITELCETADLCTILTANDFKPPREDVIVGVVGELFLQYLLVRSDCSVERGNGSLGSEAGNKARAEWQVTSWMRESQSRLPSAADRRINDTPALSPQSSEPNSLVGTPTLCRTRTAPGSAKQLDVNESETDQYVTRMTADLASLQKRDAELRLDDIDVQLTGRNVLATVSLLRRRLLSGQEVAAASPATLSQYHALPPKKIEWLEKNHGKPSRAKDLTEGQGVQPVEQVLRTWAGFTSHLFWYFARSSSEMNEVQLWRFLEVCGVGQRPLTPSVLCRIIDQVLSPHLTKILRTAEAVAAVSRRRDQQRGEREDVGEMQYGGRPQGPLDSDALEVALQEEGDVRRLRPVDFTEIIVRIADAKYANVYSLKESTDRFLFALERSMLNLSPPTVFVTPLYSPAVQHVVSFFTPDISRMFFFMCKQQARHSTHSERLSVSITDEQEPSIRFSRTISADTIFTMLADAGILAPDASLMLPNPDSRRPVETLLPAVNRSRRVRAQAQETRRGSGEALSSIFLDMSRSSTAALMDTRQSAGFWVDAAEADGTLAASVHQPPIDASMGRLGVRITRDGVLRLLTAVQQQIPHSSHSRVSLSSFLELLFLLSLHCIPDPLVYPSRKLAQLMSLLLIRLKAKYCNTTLLISNIPPIPLEGDEHINFRALGPTLNP